MQATPAMIASLAPGELLVRIVRDGWTIPPDHVAIAQASRELRSFTPKPGTYRGRASDEAHADCLAGAA